LAEREASIWIRLKGARQLGSGLKDAGKSFVDVGKRAAEFVSGGLRGFTSLASKSMLVHGTMMQMRGGFEVLKSGAAVLTRGFVEMGRRAVSALKSSGGALRSVGRSFVDIGKRGVGAISRISSSIFSLKSLIMTGLVYGAFRVLKNTISDLTGAYSVQQDAIQKLNVNLQSQGNFSEMVTKRLQRQAAAMQQVTAYGDEEIIQGQAMLASYGATGDQIERMTPIVLNFAAATGQNLASAFDLAGKASVGYTGTLSRYGIIIDENIPKTQKFEAAMAAMAQRGGMAAEEMAKTASGRLKQMTNLWGDLKEKLGEFIATSPGAGKVIDSISRQIEKAIGWLDKNSEAISNLVEKGYEKLIETGKSLKKSFVEIANDPATYEWLARIETGLKAVWYGAEMAVRSIDRIARRISGHEAQSRAKLQHQTTNEIVKLELEMQDPKFLASFKSEEAKEMVRKQMRSRVAQLKANRAKMEAEDQADYGMSANEYAKRGEESDKAFVARLGDVYDDLSKTAGFGRHGMGDLAKDRLISGLKSPATAEEKARDEQRRLHEEGIKELNKEAYEIQQKLSAVEVTINVNGAGVGADEAARISKEEAEKMARELQKRLEENERETARRHNRGVALGLATS
jgi:hypothetical protein